MRCGEAKKRVETLLDDVDFSTLLFVIDGQNVETLRGSIALRDLLRADDSGTLQDVMDPYVQTLTPFDDASRAAYRIVAGQLPAMPVINTRGEIIGAMTIEAAIGRLLPSNTNFQRLRVFS
jgi:Mg/Co/Ni transporter MgtE